MRRRRAGRRRRRRRRRGCESKIWRGKPTCWEESRKK
jgi:hypothetical protein